MLSDRSKDFGVPVRLSLEDSKPMYRQIETQLKGFILSGQLGPGTQLPSARGLAKELACSVITTHRAYGDLEKGGFITTRQGMGAVVAELEEDRRDVFRREPVYAAFEAAVGAGRRAGFSDTELREMFEEVLPKGGDDA